MQEGQSLYENKFGDNVSCRVISQLFAGEGGIAFRRDTLPGYDSDYAKVALLKQQPDCAKPARLGPGCLKGLSRAKVLYSSK